MGLCTYCGEPATSVDHIVPLAYTSGPVKRRKQGTINNGYLKVLACHECNSLLGSNLITDISNRATYIARQLGRRYKKLLKQPKWTNDELDGLDGRLRKIVEASILEKDRIRSRISWALKKSAD